MFSSVHQRRINVLLMVAICLLAVAVHGAEKKSSPAKPATAKSTGKHCLWRVTSASAPFYLLGSIHALRSSDYPLPAVMENAIQQAQQFYFEVNPDQDPQAARKMAAAAIYPKGGQIKGKIKPETYKHLMKITKSGYNVWQHFRPWAIAIFILQHPGFQGVRSAYGVESYIERKARARKRPIHGLATVDEHINVMAGMSEIEAEVFLLQALVYGSQLHARYSEAVAAWKTGDTQRIAALEFERIAEAPNLNDRILAHRNIRWIPKIEAAIKSGQPTMVVAGAAHFAGPNNVIALLRARGHTIEQL